MNFSFVRCEVANSGLQRIIVKSSSVNQPHLLAESSITYQSLMME